MAWFWYALCASLLWGIAYVAHQYLLRYLTVFELVFLEALFVIVVYTPFFIAYGKFSSLLIKLADIKLSLILLLSCCVYIAAAIFIFKSINASNASLAAIVEASYPLFTMLFAFILLGEVQFTLNTLIGAVFIIIGLIIVNQGG
jgi:drug/metabolite transporter (DMT)-like permease